MDTKDFNDKVVLVTAQPSEIAAAAVWLCSDAASYVMGQMLVIDGGTTIGGFEL